MKALTGLILVLTVALNGCGESTNIKAAKKIIEETLSDPLSVQYRNITESEHGLICGEVNAKNRMGGYAGFKKFLIRKTDGVYTQESLGIGVSESVHKLVCEIGL